jgi:hypothetical protein
MVLNEFFWVFDAKETSEIASFTHLLVDLLVDTLGFVPFGHVGLNLVLDPFSDFSAEGGVGFVEVRGVVLCYLVDCRVKDVLDVRLDTKQDRQKELAGQKGPSLPHLPPLRTGLPAPLRQCQTLPAVRPSALASRREVSQEALEGLLWLWSLMSRLAACF